MNESNATIKHKGKVISIENKTILVDIGSHSACSSCGANNYCSSFGKNEKIIEVIKNNIANIKIGDEVTIVLKESKGFIALLFGYILATIIAILFLILGLIILKNEALAALIALIGLGLYYFIIWCFKDKFKTTFNFKIENLGSN